MLDYLPNDDSGPAWWIDPKDADPRSEESRQMAVLRVGKIICPGVDFIAIPNAAKRSNWEINKAKREGLRAGALDLVATWRATNLTPGIAFIEMKNGKEMPSDNQADRLNLYTRQGHLCGVFRQEASVMDFLRRHGAPFIGRMA